MQLVPGSDEDLELKTFDWILETFTQEELSIKLKFDHHEHISRGFVDVMHVEFYNTGAFLVQTVEGIEPIPDGYQIEVPLPTQTPGLFE